MEGVGKEEGGRERRTVVSGGGELGGRSESWNGTYFTHLPYGEVSPQLPLNAFLSRVA